MTWLLPALCALMAVCWFFLGWRKAALSFAELAALFIALHVLATEIH